MLLLWHLRSIVVFVLALAIAVGGLVGIYGLMSHYRSLSRNSTAANSEAGPDVATTGIEEFLRISSIDQIVSGINAMRSSPTSRSADMPARIYNFDCQLKAADRIHELDPDEKQELFANMTILRALTKIEESTIEQEMVFADRHRQLRANSERFLNDENPRLRQAAQLGRVVLGIREMCTDGDAETMEADYHRTLNLYEELAHENVDNYVVAHRLFKLLDLIQQRCDRAQWMAFMATFRDAYQESRIGQIEAFATQVDQWLALEQLSAAK